MGNSESVRHPPMVHVGAGDSPRVVQRVHEAERTRPGETARGHVDREELGELSLGIGPREDVLDRVLLLRFSALVTKDESASEKC